LAILDIDPFRLLYERFTNTRLPARAVLTDALTESGVAADAAEEGVDTFIVELRFVDLLQTLSGTERIVTLDHLLDALPTSTIVSVAPSAIGNEQRNLVAQEHAEFETTCFYATRIGEEASLRSVPREYRGTSASAFQSKGQTSDAIDKPEMITRQVSEYLLRSRLVTADLWFRNPNVFCEVAIRHAARLPVVQIIRSG
jgi:hypothetical protein